MPELTTEQKAMCNIDHMIKGKAKNDQREEKLHKAICEYIGYQYKNIYFQSDPSGLSGIGERAKVLLKKTRSGHKHLDLTIFKKSFDGKFSLLILECKKESPYLKDGVTLSNSEHIQKQLSSMNLLRAEGYRCVFVWTLDMAIVEIEQYLGKPVTDNQPLF